MQIKLTSEGKGDARKMLFAVASGLAFGGLDDRVEAFEDAVVEMWNLSNVMAASGYPLRTT